jgi:hypothetical protein
MNKIGDVPGCFICTPETLRSLEIELGGPLESPSIRRNLNGIPVYVIEHAPPDVLTPLPEDIGNVKPLVFQGREDTADDEVCAYCVHPEDDGSELTPQEWSAYKSDHCWHCDKHVGDGEGIERCSHLFCDCGCFEAWAEVD